MWQCPVWWLLFLERPLPYFTLPYVRRGLRLTPSAEATVVGRDSECAFPKCQYTQSIKSLGDRLQERQESWATAKMTARCTLYVGAEKFRRVAECAHGYFAQNFNGVLFRSILWMCLQNWQFIALPVPEIIRGILKLWAVSAYAHLPFVQNF